MSEWKELNKKSLSELVVINNGIDYKSNPKGNSVIPIYGTGGVMGYTTIALNEGPAILSGRKGSINRPFYVEGKFWNVDTIFCLKPLRDNDAKWLYYSLLNEDMTKLNEATGVPSVTSKSLYKLRINYVQPETQKRIAQILTTCDTVIEQTQAAIEKYKAIKQGMLHDLFTRGLTSNGQLRPTPQQAPELYKQSELGLIPKEWEVKRLEEIAFVNPQTCIPNACDSKSVVSFFKMEDVSNDGYIINNNPIPISKLQKRGFTMFQDSDVLFAKITPCMENGKGALALNLHNGIGFGSTEFHVFRPRELSTIHFLYYLSISPKFRLQAESQMTGSAGQQRVSTKYLVNYRIATPPSDEQLNIGKRLISIDTKLQSEESLLSKYQSIKKGLMSDLLSGKREV